jgi:Tol biopolymer transport system component/surface antigen
MDAGDECTNYAAYVESTVFGVATPGYSLGNAGDWANNAKNHVTVNGTPTVGAVAEWNGGDYGMGSDGHVAIVEQVGPNNSYIVISQQNISTDTNGYDWTKINAGGSKTQWEEWPDNFIHFPIKTYHGNIVQSSSDTSTQKMSWRVGADGRRHWIPTISDYWCLKNNGVPGPVPLNLGFLNTILPVSGSEASCGGDVNGDGSVDITDLSYLCSEYGTPGKYADINLSGKVDIIDLSILLSQWGKSPTPVAIKPSAVGAALQPAARTRRVARAVPVKLARPSQVSGVGGLGGNDVSSGPSVSADGNLVVFSSLASNLVAGDTNGVLDVFAWNRSAGTVTRVSVDAAGNQFNTPSADAKVSPNGRYATFDSGGDVYVKDLQTGALERISQPNSDPAGEPDQPAYANGVTSSGLVVFQSKATNLVAGDTNGAFDVFVRQLQDAPIEQVSVSSDSAGGVEGNADSYTGAASDDGRYVVFASRATNLAAGNSNGQAGIFVRDLATGTTTLVSGPPGGGQADGDAGFPSISSNGQLVAFNSDATNLAAGNPSGYQQVYVQNLATGTLQRASQTNDGTAGNGDSTESALSGDGSRVAFRSIATNLAAGDTNGADDVFVQDLARHLISRVSVTAKLAQGNSSSFGPSLNSGGTIIAFPSDATNLTGSAAGTAEQVIASDITQLPLSGATPTITGTAKVGATLTAHPGKWGPAGVQLRYQWYASGTAITGATAAALKLAAAQHGKRITVKVTASLTGYATATLTSKATAKVAAVTMRSY